MTNNWNFNGGSAGASCAPRVPISSLPSLGPLSFNLANLPMAPGF